MNHRSFVDSQHCYSGHLLPFLFPIRKIAIMPAERRADNILILCPCFFCECRVRRKRRAVLAHLRRQNTPTIPCPCRECHGVFDIPISDVVHHLEHNGCDEPPPLDPLALPPQHIPGPSGEPVRVMRTPLFECKRRVRFLF